MQTEDKANRRIPFMDLSWQWRQIESEVLPAFKQLGESSAFILGPFVEAFEREVAEYLGVDHAIGVSSGTAALHLALIAAGIGPGDSVLVPANTFIASVWAILYVGATPVLCDVDPHTWLIDLDDAGRRVDPSVKAILPVHLYGKGVEPAALLSFADRHGLLVVEDAAQAIGASAGTERAGSFGLAGCFSFYPGKNLGAGGEGGLVTTKDAAIAERIRRLRNHGQSKRYVHDEVGFNYRMDGVQALILSRKLVHIDAWTTQRRILAARYLDGLANCNLQLPIWKEGDVWHLFVVHTPRRDELNAFLRGEGIDCGLHYPVPLHRQPCLQHLNVSESTVANSERNARECLSLPLYPGLPLNDVDFIIDRVHRFFADR